MSQDAQQPEQTAYDGYANKNDNTSLHAKPGPNRTHHFGVAGPSAGKREQQNVRQRQDQAGQNGFAQTAETGGREPIRHAPHGHSHRQGVRNPTVPDIRDSTDQ